MRLDHLIDQQRARIQTERISERTPVSNPGSDNSGVSFDQILQKQMESEKKLSFTKHAQLRMIQRNINLTNEHMDRLNSAVEKAGQKGVKDTLVLMDKMAFIVSVANNTVVTAMNGNDIEGNVFTQIDGAVVV